MNPGVFHNIFHDESGSETGAMDCMMNPFKNNTIIHCIYLKYMK
jgi:hypothetical protein